MNYTLILGIIAVVVAVAYITYTLWKGSKEPKITEPPEEEMGPDSEGGGNQN